MSRGRSPKKSPEAHWIAYEWMFHEVNIPNKAGEQCSERQEYGCAIRPQRIAASHRVSHKWSPQAHQNAPDHARENTFLRDGTSGGGQTAVSLPVQNDRDESAGNTEGQEYRIPFRLQRITQNYSYDQRDANRNRKRDGQSGHINRGYEQEVGKVKQSSADQCIDNVRGICGVNVVQEARGIVARASHGEGKNQGDQEYADSIVPVKKLEAIILDALISIRPGPPADGAGCHHQKGDLETVRSEHRGSFGRLRVRERRSESVCVLFVLVVLVAEAAT